MKVIWATLLSCWISPSLRVNKAFAEFFDGPLHVGKPMTKSALSGYNDTLEHRGEPYESMHALKTGARNPGSWPWAQVNVPYRRNRRFGDLTSVTIPDHIDILYELPNGRPGPHASP